MIHSKITNESDQQTNPFADNIDEGQEKPNDIPIDDDLL